MNTYEMRVLYTNAYSNFASVLLNNFFSFFLFFSSWEQMLGLTLDVGAPEILSLSTESFREMRNLQLHQLNGVSRRTGSLNFLPKGLNMALLAWICFEILTIRFSTGQTSCS